MVYILDDDLIQFLDFFNQGNACLYGGMLEVLLKQIQALVMQRKSQLPKKAVRNDYPMIYWVIAPAHKKFLYHDARTKFNLCLESVVKGYPNMRVVKMKEIWDYHRDDLVENNSIALVGLSIYWKSVDAAIRFNVEKREAILKKL